MTKNFSLIVSIPGLGLGLALLACGDNRALPDAGAPIDAPAGPPRAVVVAGDFVSGHPGVLSTLDPATRMVMPNVGPALAVGADPILRHFGGELFIINRIENNVTILDDQTLALKEQLGTGAGTNPQDVAVRGQKLFVATFGGTGLLVLTRGSATPVAVDLSADDPDGKPNCNSVYLVGTDAYVSCGLLDNADKFKPRGPGKVYIVDSTTNAIKTSLTLGHANPFGVFEQVPAAAPSGAGELLMPTALFPVPPSTALPSGCIERITTGATPAAAGCLINNTDLGGYASRIAFQIDKEGALLWVAAPTTYPKSDLRAYDMSINSLWAGPLNAANQAIGDLALCPGGELVLADTTMNANGLRVYSGAAELTKAVQPIGLPPSSSHGLVCY